MILHMEKNEMMLKSTSGFCMPFLMNEGEQPEVLLDYGEQTHPSSGEPSFNQGIDFACKEKPLFAVATGIVTGVGSDPVHENYMTVRHGDYEVRYGHLKDYSAGYGTQVRAGQPLATSGEFLHFGVRFRGEYIEPGPFMNTILDNIALLKTMGMASGLADNGLEGMVHTRYDQDMDEIGRLLMQYFPAYLSDLDNKAYVPRPNFEMFLRQLMSQGAQRNYLFEEMPSMGNPLGLGARSAPFVSKVQDTLLTDFLRYLGTQKGIFPSSWGEGQKKNFIARQQMTV